MVRSRITKKHKHTNFISYTDKKRCLKNYNIAETNVNKAIEKLGKLEDIMEEFNINSINQLINILKAWEVTKEELQIVFKGKNYYGEPLRRYEVNIIGQNKIDTLNKALEVNNND